MSNYFDEYEVQKRIRRQYRRRFVYRVHILITLIAVAINLFWHFDLFRKHGAYLDTPYYVGQMLIITVFLLVLLFLHWLWLRYREQMEAAVDREMKTVYEYRKRKHDEIYEYAHLDDTGEFVPEDDYPQKRLERR